MDELVLIKDIIEGMNKLQQKEVFKIFLVNNVDYNENNNGIFINLTNINKNIIKELKKYIEYVNKQNNFLNKQEKQKEMYLKNYFSNNINDEQQSNGEVSNSLCLN